MYRVFGCDHPPGSVYILLRYVRTKVGWRKPPAYAAESIRNKWTGYYDLPTCEVPQYGITLGVGPAISTKYVASFDPRDLSIRMRIAELQAVADCPVGLVGSHLLGLGTPLSDLDIVLSGHRAVDGGRRILAELAEDTHLPIEPSIAFRKLFTLVNNCVPRIAERNIYTGRVLWEGKRVKIDILYSENEDGIFSRDSLVLGTSAGVSIAEELTVVDASRRCYFPGSLICKTASGVEVVVSVLDHTLSYLLEGDRMSLRVRKVIVGDAETLVGLELLSLDLR